MAYPLLKKSAAFILFLFLGTAQSVFAAEPDLIAVLGDSLTAGYNLPASSAFPARLEKALRAEGYNVTVLNAGVSGDTTAGGLMRLPSVLERRPRALIVELGANDSFRGVDPSEAEANLAQIIAAGQKAGARVLLAGMVAPYSMGDEYVAAFNGMYPRLSEKYGVPLYPFFMEGIMNYATGEANETFLLSDRLHPSAAGVDEIVHRILPHVKDLIKPFAVKSTAE